MGVSHRKLNKSGWVCPELPGVQLASQQGGSEGAGGRSKFQSFGKLGSQGVTSGAGKHCKVFSDNTNKYLIDQQILVGGMLYFEVTPISSSQARVVHKGTDWCI